MRVGIVAAVVAIACGATQALAGEQITYHYDARGRVVGVTNTGTVNSGMNATYTLDDRDNRTAVAVTGAPNGSGRVIVLPLGGLFVMPIN